MLHSHTFTTLKFVGNLEFGYGYRFFFAVLLLQHMFAYLSLSTITGLRTTQVLKVSQKMKTQNQFESGHLRKNI